MYHLTLLVDGREPDGLPYDAAFLLENLYVAELAETLFEMLIKRIKRI